MFSGKALGMGRVGEAAASQNKERAHLWMISNGKARQGSRRARLGLFRQEGQSTKAPGLHEEAQALELRVHPG